MNNDLISELNASINAVYRTAEDLELAIVSMIDGNTELTEDNLFNIVNGIKEIHKLRCESLSSALMNLKVFKGE
jgi:hypothetical protein